MATNLTDIIKKVRTALRGEEVRGSIADGLEYCGQISENAKADMEATASAAKEAMNKTASDAKTTIETSAASTKEQLSKDIDAKAAAALKSIPESYTELDGSVKQVKEDLDNLDLHIPDLGIGAISNIYPFNFESQYKYRVSTKNKITFDKDTVFHVKNGYLVGIRYDFDDVDEKSADTGWIKQSFCFRKGKEYIVQIRKEQEDTNHIISLADFNEYKYAFFSLPLKELDVLKWVNQIEFRKIYFVLLGHISDGIYIPGRTTTRAVSDVFEYSGKILIIDKTHKYKIAYAEWNTNDNEYTTSCIWRRWNEKEAIVDAKSGKKYCFHFMKIDNSDIDIEDLSNSLIVSYALNSENENIIGKLSEKKIYKIANEQKIYSECYYWDVKPEMYIEQDCTNLGDKYLFVGASNENDTAQYNGKLFVMSKDLKKQKQLSHNLGHCASVDFSKVTGALIFGNGSTNKSIKARIDILPNAISVLETRETVTLSDTISIQLDNSWHGLTACFGGSGDSCYILYFTDEMGDNCIIAQCKLGLGNSDLSSDGFGTFIAGKGSNEYNGTLKIIKTYNPIYLNVLQGAEFYHGKIWVMTSNDKVRAYQLQLTEDGNVIIENCYGFDQLSNDGINVAYESEGMVHVDEHTLMTSIFTNHTPKTICLEV